MGALFIGHYSPEVIGDYVAGPSHVLPTNRTARFTNGLSVNDFLTRNTVIHLSKDTFEQIADSAQHIAHVGSIIQSPTVYFNTSVLGSVIEMIYIDKNESPVTPLDQKQ